MAILFLQHGDCLHGGRAFQLPTQEAPFFVCKPSSTSILLRYITILQTSINSINLLPTLSYSVYPLLPLSLSPQPQLLNCALHPSLPFSLPFTSLPPPLPLLAPPPSLSKILSISFASKKGTRTDVHASCKSPLVVAFSSRSSAGAIVAPAKVAGNTGWQRQASHGGH